MPMNNNTNDSSSATENPKKEKTIFRAPHDKDNPYVIISLKMIYDNNLSLEARGFMASLLALPDDWEFHPMHLAKHFGVSKHKIYKLLNELVTHGYLERIEKKSHNLFSSVIYRLFENYSCSKVVPFPNSPYPKNRDTENISLKQKESLDQSEELKECLPCHEFSDTENRDTSYNVYIPSTKEKYISPILTDGLSAFLFEKIKELNPNHKKPATFKEWDLHIERMIRLDKRSPAEIRAVIEWVAKDPFWCTVILSTQKLRKQFDRLFILMNKTSAKTSQQKETSKQVDTFKENQSWFKSFYFNLLKKFPSLSNFLTYSDNCVSMKTQKGVAPLGYSSYGFKDQIMNFARNAQFI